MKRVSREHASEYNMVIKEPRLVVEPGESFVVETEDALNGLIRTEDDLPVHEVLGARLERQEFNPLVGPIVVEGTKPGDVLLVHVEDIVVADQGVSCIFDGVGPLADSAKYPECRGPATKIIRHLPGPSGTTSDGKGVFNDPDRLGPQPPHRYHRYHPAPPGGGGCRFRVRPGTARREH